MSNAEQKEELNFRIGQGRSRPQYKVQSIQCPNCGSPLEQQTETSILITCPACSSNLDLGDAEAKVLGKNKRRNYPNLNIPLQTELKFEGEIYKVIARLVYQDGWGDYTYEYLLFNPFFGSFYLSRYENDYTTSRPSRTFLKENPFQQNEGNQNQSYDGQTWIFEEKSTMRLRFVEGALPWMAKAGDTHEYAALRSAKDKTLAIEVEREFGKEGAELEHVLTKSIPASFVKNAIQDPVLREKIFPPPPPPPSKLPFVAALVICILGAVFGFSNVGVSEGVFYNRIAKEDLAEDRISKSFEITKIKYPVQVCLASNLNNQWMYAQWAIIKVKNPTSEAQSYTSFSEEQSAADSTTKDDYLVHIADDEISYYYGGSGEDSWSEGSRSKCHSIIFSETGHYRVVTKAISGKLDTANTPNNNLAITIEQNAKEDFGFIFLIFISALIGIRSLIGIFRKAPVT